MRNKKIIFYNKDGIPEDSYIKLWYIRRFPHEFNHKKTVSVEYINLRNSRRKAINEPNNNKTIV